MADFTEDFNTYSVSKLPTFREKFTYSTKAEADLNWISQDEPDNQVDVQKENFFYTIKRDGVNRGSSIDLGAPVSDVKWTLRCKVTIGTPYTVTSSLSSGFSFGLEDTDSSVGLGFLNNFLKITLINTIIGGGSQHQNVSLFEGASNGIEGTTTGWTAGDTRYIELKRLSRTEFQTTIYSDANYSVIIDRLIKTVPAGVTGLRYIKIGGPADNEPSYNGVFTGTVDDIEFWGERATPTFEDKFDMGDNWSDTGTGFGVNTGTEVFDGSLTLNGADNHSSFDLQSIIGETVDDEKWVLRFRVKILSLVGSGSTGFTFAIDSSEPRGGLAGSTRSLLAGAFDLFDSIPLAYGVGNHTPADASVLSIQALPASKVLATISTNGTTDYWVEFKRTSATENTMRVFTDETFTTPLAGLSSRTIPSTTVGLRYIKFYDRELNTSGSMTFEVDDVEFYNGVSSVTSEGAQQGDVTFEDNFELKTATLTDDFTSYANQGEADAVWVPVGANPVQVNVTTDVIDWDFKADNTNNACAFDIQTALGSGINASDTNWTLRWKMIVANNTQTGSTVNYGHVGLFDTDQSVDEDSASDYICTRFLRGSIASQNNPLIDSGDAKIPSSDAFGDVEFVGDMVVGTLFYELKRTSATTYECTQYSDAGYTTVVERVSSSCSASIVNLRYIKIQGRDALDPGGTLDGTIDDIEFYNGESVITRWINMSGDKVVVNTGTCVMDWDSSGATLYNEGMVADVLGETINDKNWTLRCKLNINTLIEGTDATANDLWVGLSGDNTDTPEVAQDFVGFRITAQDLASTSKWIIENTLNTVPNTSPADTLDTPVIEPVAGTFYLELSRTDSTSYTGTVYSDADFTTVVTTGTFTMANITNLRYLKVMVSNFDGTGDSTFDGTIDNIEFYNGVSVPRTPSFGATKLFEDNVWDDQGWVTQDATAMAVNTGTQVLDINVLRDSTQDAIAFDLGAGVLSETRWGLRFKYDITAVNPVNTGTKRIACGIFNTDGVASIASPQDYIGINFNLATDTTAIISNATNNTNPQSISFGTTFISVITQVQTYYIEIIRISATSYSVEIFSDPDYSISLEKQTLDTISSAISGLRYIKFLGDETSGPVAGSFTGTIDDIELWDGQAPLDHKNKWRVLDL